MGNHLKKARNNYICYRCKEVIFAGEEYVPGKYKYHPICQSLSGRKEFRVTENLQIFLGLVNGGPKLICEIPLHPAVTNTCYHKASLLGYPVYKMVFPRKRGTITIYYFQNDRFKAWERIKKLGKMPKGKYKDYGIAMLGREETNRRRKYGDI